MRRVLMLIEAGGRRRAQDTERLALVISLGFHGDPKKIEGSIPIPDAVHHDPYSVDVKPLGKKPTPSDDGAFDNTPWWGEGK